MSVNAMNGAPAPDFIVFRRFGGPGRPGRDERGFPRRYPHVDMFNDDARAVIDAEFEIIGCEPPRRSIGDKIGRAWTWITSRLPRG